MTIILLVLNTVSAVFAGPRENSLRDGRKAYLTGDYESSSQHFAEALAEAPGDPEALFDLGSSRFREQDFESAAARFQQVADSEDPEWSSSAWYNLGNTQLEQQDPQKAVKSFVEALKRDPDLVEARNNLELALQMLDQQQEEQDQNQDGEKGEDGDQEDQEQDQQNQDQQQSDSSENQKDGENSQKQDPQESQDQQNQQQDQQQKDEQESSQQEQNQSSEEQQAQPDSTQMSHPDSLIDLEQISPEQLRQILQAVEAQEKEALKKQLEKLPASRRRVEKDW